MHKRWTPIHCYQISPPGGKMGVLTIFMGFYGFKGAMSGRRAKEGEGPQWLGHRRLTLVWCSMVAPVGTTPLSLARGCILPCFISARIKGIQKQSQSWKVCVISCFYILKMYHVLKQPMGVKVSKIRDIPNFRWSQTHRQGKVCYCSGI